MVFLRVEKYLAIKTKLDRMKEISRGKKDIVKYVILRK
jgi:hypothetical protein